MSSTTVKMALLKPKPGSLTPPPWSTIGSLPWTQWGRRGSPKTPGRYGPLLTNHGSATAYHLRQS